MSSLTPQEEKAPHRHEFQFYSGDAVFLDTFARFYCCCPRRSGVAFRKLAQFSFRHSKFRGATIQTDNKLWKYPHDGLINVVGTAKMDAHLSGELALAD
jgi:hypothetical protein